MAALGQARCWSGYASLSAPKSFPVSRLKIDQTFVRDLVHDEDDRSITAAAISLGQRMNMIVIAEGRNPPRS
jgi:EAL domain-containing protein (putative c-di-GMP-specific phosphodiesterase class I)